MIPPARNMSSWPSPGRAARCSNRAIAADRTTASADGPQAKLPYWLKLARNRKRLHRLCFRRWHQLARRRQRHQSLNKNLSVGLALTAHNNSVLELDVVRAGQFHLPNFLKVCLKKVGRGVPPPKHPVGWRILDFVQNGEAGEVPALTLRFRFRQGVHKFQMAGKSFSSQNNQTQSSGDFAEKRPGFDPL